MSAGRRTAAALTLVAVAFAAAACSSGPTTTASTTHPPTTVNPAKGGVQLKALPIPGAASSTYPRLLVARGRGDKSLGTIAVRRGTVFAQTVCNGPGSLDLVHLFAQGPCNNQTGVTSFAAPPSRRLTITIRASASTAWAVYVSQAT